MKRLVAIIALLFLFAYHAEAQVNYGVSVQGAVTPNDCTAFASPWVIKDSGVSCAGGSASISVGTTVIVGGSNTYILYDNNGVIGAEGTLPVANGGTGQSLNANMVRMQKVAVSAALSNLVSNPVNSVTTITAGTSAPSTTGFTNLLNGQGYVASPTGTTTSGSNVITSVSSVSNLVAGMPVLENMSSGAYPANIPLGATVTSVGTNTVTMSKLATGSASVTLHFPSDLINYIGGVPVDYSDNLQVASATSGNSSNIWTQSGYAIEFMTDAANFSTSATSIIFAGYQNSATAQSFRVAVDDVYQSSGPTTFGAGSVNGYISIQFATGGVHKVRMEFTSAQTIESIYVLTGASIWLPTYSYQVRAAFFGDSYMSTGSAVSFFMRNLAAQTALLLGWQPDFPSVAGTGYTNNGTSNYAWYASQRTRDVGIRSYNAIVVLGSINDAGASAGTIQADALTTFQGLRTNAPNATIFVFGCPTTITTNQAAATIVENAVSAAFTQWGDGNSYFIPITTDPDGDWINSNNDTEYIYSGDDQHPTDPAGTNYYAYKMAQKVKNILAVGAY